jgi:2-polyprenyl-3-methyl-5-hydroxy-6-metoxy-1,4-benzoquinol methylase
MHPLETALLTRADAAQTIRGDYQYVALHEGHPIQRFWHYNKQLTIARYLPPERGDVVIDVGCGSGVISSFLAHSGARTLGIDASHDAIAFASRTFTAENLSFRRGAFHEVFPLEEPVDKIYCLEMIEHIYTHEAIEMLAVFRDSLRPGGRLYLTTPNGRSMWPLIEWLMDTLHLAPKMADYQHLARYSPASLPGLCTSAGFDVEHVVTTCFAAPWLAPLSWNLALRANRAENDSALGAILVCIARKPTC